MSRVPGVNVTPYAEPYWDRQPLTCSHHGKIQDHDHDFYMQFAIIIAGLDSISARRWINATLVDMVDPENPDSLKPLIDGGTEGKSGADLGMTLMLGFKGQSRVILPTVTACYECSVS